MPVKEIQSGQLNEQVPLMHNQAFLRYKIKKIKGTYLFIELSKKTGLQIFIDQKVERPNQQDYNWAFGDFDISFIKKLKVNPDMRDIFNNASIFDIN